MLDSSLEFPNDFAVGVAAVVAIRRRCWDKVDNDNAVLAKFLIYIIYGMVLKLFVTGLLSHIGVCTSNYLVSRSRSCVC